jgi:sigma-B regulation protein RsbU (phosphoserine phosphatase)
VDDDESNREILARHLERQGHRVARARDGLEGLAMLRKDSFDILILDVMMPGMNGYQLLEAVKSDEGLKDVQVIVISALDDTKGIARCIELGAEDYLPREFEPVILRARIEACLERRSLLRRQALYLAAVRKSARLLDEGLAEGAEYVRGLLPPRISDKGLKADWAFIPSRALGGDIFSYHPIGERRLAIFLLDVSGHGIGAALYSVTLMNIIRNQALVGADFGDPASVLRRLNEAFQMESQNNLYFTAWYGVWDEKTRELSWSSAGGPPAVLLLPGGGVERLATDGMAIGFDPSAAYRNDRLALPPGSRLYLFSDGIYEVTTRDGTMLGLDAFIGILAAVTRKADPPSLQDVTEMVRGLSLTGTFADDVSLVEAVLG